ncbi:hypothetical protein DDD_0702 [Nonlabens dokdonensis DSW-6]|jgi:hypothetical protein|uniref:Uncharacterized protein n=1 Tax=Nonlabens dokdonensis (strain DSM 17205 / KCTC 12402 / DSW-6) TaxID=592029 RepID=L7W6U8_NONDD|nr:hypothetical protein DDD_0702 [Nonlabens dokdonensis DSW-6]
MMKAMIALTVVAGKSEDNVGSPEGLRDALREKSKEHPNVKF